MTQLTRHKALVEDVAKAMFFIAVLTNSTHILSGVVKVLLFMQPCL